MDDIKREPSYVKIYLDGVHKLYELPASCSSVLYELIKRAKATEDGMVVWLNREIKKDIMNSSPRISTLSTVDNSLGIMLKNQVIYRLGTGTFLLSPYIFGGKPWSGTKRWREKLQSTISSI